MDLSSRKYKNRLPDFPKYLPVVSIDERNQSKFSGVFNGVEVEVKNLDEAEELQRCGCFGFRAFQRRQQDFDVVEGHYEVFDGLSDRGGIEEEKIPIRKLEFNKTDNQDVLRLFLEEAFFLHHSLKCLQIFDGDGVLMTTEKLWTEFIKVRDGFVRLFVAYHFLRAKNWVVRNGLKFGSDYILYKIGPEYYHSTFMVKIIDAAHSYAMDFPSNQFLGWYRIAETSKKTCLLLTVHPPSPNTELETTMDLFKNLSKFKVSYVTLKRFNYLTGGKSHKV